MTKAKIDILLNKYWNCNTSVEEENLLRDYFAWEEVAEEHRPYKPLFSYLERTQAICLDDDFEDRILEKIAAAEKNETKRKYVQIKIFEPFFKIAASVAAVAIIGSAIFLIERQNSQVFAETYNDPHAAMIQATAALEKLSEALKQSEQASIESIQELQTLDLDWHAIDSLTLATESTNDEFLKPENKKE